MAGGGVVIVAAEAVADHHIAVLDRPREPVHHGPPELAVAADAHPDLIAGAEAEGVGR